MKEVVKEVVIGEEVVIGVGVVVTSCGVVVSYFTVALSEKEGHDSLNTIHLILDSVLNCKTQDKV